MKLLAIVLKIEKGFIEFVTRAVSYLRKI